MVTVNYFENYYYFFNFFNNKATEEKNTTNTKESWDVAGNAQDDMEQLKNKEKVANEVKIQFSIPENTYESVYYADSCIYGYLFNRKNFSEVWRLFAFIVFLFVIMYIMYFILDMAFGPKTYNTKGQDKDFPSFLSAQC